MTPPEFRARLKALGLTIGGFALLTGPQRDTAANWGKVRGGSLQEFPAWVPLLLTAWERLPDMNEAISAALALYNEKTGNS